MQILAPHSKRPVGVNILTSGGLKAGCQLTNDAIAHGSRWGTR
jgi:hypothetical protein